MANTTILDLPVVVTASGQEQIPCDSTNSSATTVTKRITSAQIAALAANVPTLTLNALSAFGNSSSAAAVGTSIAGTAGQVFRVNDAGTQLGFGQVNLSNTASVTGSVPLASIAALSVLGVTGTATAVPAAITGTTDKVLIVNHGGTALLFGQVNLSTTAAITGTLGVALGGSGTSTVFSSGSILFTDANGSFSQNNSSFSWDNANARLAIGSANIGRLVFVQGTNTSSTANEITIRAYQAAFEVLNSASSQNWYFGIDDADSNKLKIGQGYSPGQGLAGSIVINTSNTVGISNALNVTGNVGIIAALNATGAATFGSTVAATGNLSTLGNLAVSGTSNTTGNATFGGTVTATGTVATLGALAVTGTANITGALTLGSNLNVTGNAGVIGTFNATGAATFGSTITATGSLSTKGALAVTGTAIMTGNVGLGGTLNVTGAVTLVVPLGVTNGGSGTGTAFTLGSVVFATASGNYAQNNANLFWDNVTSRLGVGIGSPAVTVHASGNIGATDTGTVLDNAYNGKFMSTRANASTGQHINLVRSGNFIWSIGYDFASQTFLIGPGQATDSNFTGGAGGFLIDSTFNAYVPKGSLTLGTASSTGTLIFNGKTSGAITVIPQAAAGTFNFNLPITAGTSGQPLLSGGGGGTAMSFTAMNIGTSANVTGLLAIANGGTNASTAASAVTNLGALSASATGQTMTAGFIPVTFSLGTASGTMTIVPGNGPLQNTTSASTFTFKAPANDGECDILVYNATSASTITINGYGTPTSTGDTYATTVGNRYIFMSRTIQGQSTYAWKALQ